MGVAAAALALALALVPAAPAAGAGTDVLVFSRTEGFRHESIAEGRAMLRHLGRRHGFRVTATESPAAFTAARLERYEAVVFLSTTGDVLDAPQEAALRRFVLRGGGWAGVHAAADTEYRWPFYGRLLGGARFRAHPPTQRGTVVREDGRHPSTRRLPPRWTRTDEWYAFTASPRPRARVLLRVDEATYDPAGAAMGRDHPIAWCRAVGAGRAWYTALGHTRESYADPVFRRHVLGGVLTAAGRRAADCSPRFRPARHG